MLMNVQLGLTTAVHMQFVPIQREVLTVPAWKDSREMEEFAKVFRLIIPHFELDCDL